MKKDKIIIGDEVSITAVKNEAGQVRLSKEILKAKGLRAGKDKVRPVYIADELRLMTSDEVQQLITNKG